MAITIYYYITFLRFCLFSSFRTHQLGYTSEEEREQASALLAPLNYKPLNPVSHYPLLWLDFEFTLRVDEAVVLLLRGGSEPEQEPLVVIAPIRTI